MDVVETLQRAAAFEAGHDFLGVVLAPLEGCEGAGVDHDTVADEADLGLGDELAFLDLAAGDGADLGDLEGLLDLGGGGDLFLLLRLEETLDTFLDLVDTVVDDGVEADFDALLLRGTAPGPVLSCLPSRASGT